MAKPTAASDLQHRVGFGSLQSASDGAGGTVNGYAEQFERRAAYVHLRGGEAVLAARLEGRHSQVIRVRSDSETRAVTSDWQITDKRTGQVFAVKDVTPTEDRRWIDFLVQSGVAG